jgi:hypothetical protein
MTTEIQESIEDARQEFLEYERLSDPLKRIKCFINGVEILNDILPHVPDEKQKYTINVMKLTYARNLFQSISSMDFQDMFVWMHYLLAATSVKDEREIIFQEDPALGKAFTQFYNIYKEELAEFLPE